MSDTGRSESGDGLAEWSLSLSTSHHKTPRKLRGCVGPHSGRITRQPEVGPETVNLTDNAYSSNWPAAFCRGLGTICGVAGKVPVYGICRTGGQFPADPVTTAIPADNSQQWGTFSIESPSKESPSNPLLWLRRLRRGNAERGQGLGGCDRRLTQQCHLSLIRDFD
jgi:hypothetical protein